MSEPSITLPEENALRSLSEKNVLKYMMLKTWFFRKCVLIGYNSCLTMRHIDSIMRFYVNAVVLESGRGNSITAVYDDYNMNSCITSALEMDLSVFCKNFKCLKPGKINTKFLQDKGIRHKIEHSDSVAFFTSALTMIQDKIDLAHFLNKNVLIISSYTNNDLSNNPNFCVWDTNNHLNPMRALVGLKLGKLDEKLTLEHQPENIRERWTTNLTTIS